MNAPRTRTRLSPEARRNQLFGTAKDIIEDLGLQKFSLESRSRTANYASGLLSPTTEYGERRRVNRDKTIDTALAYVLATER